MGTPKTPAPSKKRKSLNMQAGVLDSPIGRINPMRRSSIGLVTSTPVVFQTNDDEAERRNWKRLSLLQEEPQETQKTQSLPLNTLEEFLGNWVRMSVENKINAKNVWKIHIIDYLRMLVDKNAENPLQLATASLTASAKVYCLRVDDVYTEVIRLAGNLGHKGNNDKNNEGDGDEEGDNNHGGDEGAEATQRARLKKKKKGKSKTTTNPEALIGDVDLLDTAHPIFAELNTRSGDIIGTDNMFQVFAPLNSQISEYDIRTNEQFFDSTIMKRTDPGAMELDEEIKTIILPLSLPSPTVINTLKICSTFSEFSLTNWSPDEEEASNSQQNKTIMPSTTDQINLAFDINAEPQEIMDVTMEDAGDPRCYSSDEEIVQEANVVANVNLPTALAGCKPQIENIVDMRPSHPSHTRNLEYSYNLIVSGIWAGPAHWKIKSIVHRPQPRRTMQQTVPVEANAKKRKQKVAIIEMSFEELLPADEENSMAAEPFLKCSDNRLKMSTVCSWDKNKNELPIDLHVTIADTLRVFLNANWSLVPQERPASSLSIENNQYDYNNLNDSAFCNPPDPDLLDNNDNEHDYNSDHDMNHGDVFSGMDHGEEGDIMLTGENLLPAPRIIPKLFVPYSTRAKKVNMKAIKHCMWNIITRNTDDDDKENENNLNTENNIKEATETKFSVIIEKLPRLLPRDQAANISVPLGFFGLLHLANENTLKLMGDHELKDVIINKG